MPVVSSAPAGMSAVRRFLALDLGTARTRSLAVGGHAIADRASAVMGRPSGTGAPDVVRPLRHGMVADPGACLRLVRLVVQDTRLYDGRPPARVLAGVPLAASPSDRRAVRVAVSEAAGCEVTLVEEPLAAAVGAGLDVLDPRPCLVLDVGAGIVEVVAISEGNVVDAAALQLSATTGLGLAAYALEGVVDMTAGLVRRLPAVRSRGLLVTGGGAREDLLLRRLRGTLRLPVEVAAQPQYATVRGLMRLCLQPSLASGLASAAH
ncbi:rod shape-determining protein [Nonomuraea wenchangensis]|uniref:MreB/Mbl protein n=1 Tax=Nonomuraea wenchangensis TaxID=568860 RepID=A0A1I0L8G5_9ACTN|nr:rod shape-determining protein [Nonomuraea wenchangensis]SEU35655.1 MreB/Mbl protein [Nonomuraea wenchangensis]